MKEYSFDVKHNEAGQRLDKLLVETLKMSRGRVKSLLDNGRVLINRRRVLIAGWEVEDGDHIHVKIPKEIARVTFEEQSAPKKDQRAQPRQQAREEGPSKERVRVSALRNIGKPTLSYQKELDLAKQRKQAVKEERGRDHKSPKQPREEKRGFLKVYHQDKHIIVVEKEAGLLSVPQKDSKHPHVLGQIQKLLRKKYSRGSRSYVKPLHRLDSETSGIMVFALSRNGERLASQFKQHTITRRYYAVVHGKVEKEQGVIDAPLEKGRFSHGRKVRISDEGKAARTEFRVQERYAKASLLDVGVASGRTHQIRVHLSSKGHPLIGDKLYSSHGNDKIPFKRHALHAYALGFKHPVTGKKMSFRSPLPDDMKQLVDELRTE